MPLDNALSKPNKKAYAFSSGEKLSTKVFVACPDRQLQSFRGGLLQLTSVVCAFPPGRELTGDLCHILEVR